MKKKAISLFLLIIMLFQLSYVGYSESEENNSAFNAEYATDRALLVGLGILPDDFEESFDDEGLSREKAASLVVKLLDEEKNFYGYRGIFSDVKKESEYAPYIERLADLGIVKGDGDFCFRPDEMLTYSEAIEIFVNVLGFGLVQDFGVSSRLEAQSFGILDNLTMKYENVSLEDFVIMMKNTLMSGMFEQKSYGSNPKFGKTEQTLLNKIYHIVYIDGAVVKNDVTSIWSSEELSDDNVWIRLKDDSIVEIYTANPSVLRDEIGKKLRVYYKENTDTDRYEYVFHEDKKTSSDIKIGIEQIDCGGSSLVGHRVKYYDGKGRLREVKISPQYKLIYNGAVYKSDDIEWEDISDKVGYIEIIDSYGNGAYDIVKIYVYDSLVVGNISTKHDFITDKFDVTKTVDINKEHYSKVFVYDENNEEKDLSSILPGSVISVAKSDTYNQNDTILIWVSTKIVNGRVTKYSKRGSAQYIIIDDEQKYNLLDRALEGEYDANSNVIAYLDAFGNAVYIATNYLRDMQYGVVNGVSVSNGIFDPDLKLRVTNMSGETVVYDIDNKVVIDGVSYKNRLEEAGSVLRGITVASTDINIPPGVYPVRYKTNADDSAISVIDTPNKNAGGENDSLEIVGKGKYYVNSGNVFGWTVPFMTDAAVLEFTSSDYSLADAYRSDISKINVGTASMIKSNQLYNVILCKSDTESVYCDFIMKLNFADAQILYDNGLFVVDEVCESYSQKTEEIVYTVYGYLFGTYKEIWIGKDAALANTVRGLQRGDVIRFDATDDQLLIRFEMVLQHNDEYITTTKIAGHGLNPSASSSTTLIDGYVYSVKDTLVYTNVFAFGNTPKKPDDIRWADELAGGNLRYTNITPETPITVVNYAKDKISAGTFSDILSYESFGNNCSRILARYRNGILREAIIFNTGVE